MLVLCFVIGSLFVPYLRYQETRIYFICLMISGLSFKALMAKSINLFDFFRNFFDQINLRIPSYRPNKGEFT